MKRRQHGGDQAVDVKERHHVEAAIGGPEREAARDVRRRGAQVALRERDHLRTRRGARGVEHEREAGRARGSNAPATSSWPRAGSAPAQLEPAGCRAGADDDVGHRNAARRRHPARRVPLARRHQQQRGVQIVEVEGQLGLGVGGVERRARAVSRHRPGTRSPPRARWAAPGRRRRRARRRAHAASHRSRSPVAASRLDRGQGAPARRWRRSRRPRGRGVDRESLVTITADSGRSRRWGKGAGLRVSRYRPGLVDTGGTCSAGFRIHWEAP